MSVGSDVPVGNSASMMLSRMGSSYRLWQLSLAWLSNGCRWLHQRKNISRRPTLAWCTGQYVWETLLSLLDIQVGLRWEN